MDQQAISGAELDELKTVDPSTSGTEEQRFLQECSGWYQEWLHANEPQLQANAIPDTQVLVIVFSESPDVERTRLKAMGEGENRVFRGALDAGLQGTLLATQNLRRILQIRETFSSLNDAMAVCCDTLEDSDTFVIIPLTQRRVLIHPRDVSIEDWVHNPTSIPVRSQTLQISAKQIDKDIYEFYDEGLRLAKSSLSQMIWKGKQHPYPHGLADPDTFDDLSLNASELSLEHIKKMLDGAHSRLLITPTASDLARDLWEDKGKSIPIGLAEKGVQKILHAVLSSSLGFGSIVVRQEGTSEMGRYDFFLEEQDPVHPSVWTHHAVLELKVLKSFTESGNPVPAASNVDAVTDGLDQADKYRKDHSCRMAALCCYDMRKAPDVSGAIAHELDRAKALDVAIWAWPLYSTAQQARRA
ncbi:hypothetical protein [Stenotrophomonas sp. TD3]|uniref:hypothetical protein n=1 Tax=Stenotrophomonas sp. TD3 TaxID=1641707 RepID=UPI0011151339|nr:hypothetical protein [Stenotrophomonas sp. TD3]